MLQLLFFSRGGLTSCGIVDSLLLFVHIRKKTQGGFSDIKQNNDKCGRFWMNFIEKVIGYILHDHKLSGCHVFSSGFYVDNEENLI